MSKLLQPVNMGRHFFEDILGKGDWSHAAEIIAPDVIMHHPSSNTPITGIDAVTGFLNAFRSGFPDMEMVVEGAFGDEEWAAVRWRMQGTHSADLFGIPPTGHKVNVGGISVIRIGKDGKIAEDWVSEDSLGLMHQLGVIPE